MRYFKQALYLSVAAAVVAAAGGCISELENRPAYDDQRYLCDASLAAEWSQLVEQCIQERCGGVYSMRGRLQGDDITIESRLHTSAFRLADVEGSADTLLNRVDVVGKGPYFLFALKLKSLGGVAEETSTTARELVWNEGAGEITPPIARLQDSLVRGDLRIENGLENAGFRALTDSGSLLLTLQAPGELAGSFTASFGTEKDVVSGCFHTFATEVRSESL